jgi:hypothetical protein
MMTKLFIYCALLSSILLLPDRIWEKGWILLECFFTYLKKINEKNPFQKEQKSGEKLLSFLPNLEAKLAMGLKTTTDSIPRYKFYTTLLFDLLEVHQKRGISLKNILPELRLNLIKDLQFETKLQSNLLGGNLQFFVITMTTWCFIFFSSSMADLPLKSSDLIIILMVQIFGILVFNIALRKFKNHMFHKFSEAIERLYLFVSLVEIGMPVSQTLAESRVLEGGLMNHKLFSPCASRLVTLVNRWKENGLSPKIESQEIIKELWSLKENSFEQFNKGVDGLKFCVTAFFFLPAYFFYLYSIFEYFMKLN